MNTAKTIPVLRGLIETLVVQNDGVYHPLRWGRSTHPSIKKWMSANKNAEHIPKENLKTSGLEGAEMFKLRTSGGRQLLVAVKEG